MFANSLDPFHLLLLRTFFAISAAACGAWIAVSFQKVSHLGLCILISFAAGALLAVSFLEIIPETIHALGWLQGGISILSGYLLFFFITRYVFHICPACAATHTEVKFKAITSSMMIALMIHSFMDGLAIYGGCLSIAKVGVPVFLAVTYHKFPEGMALALVARSSGLSLKKSFLLSFLLEFITTLAGGLVGFFVLVPEMSKWIGFVLGHVGGGFLFLVIHALLGEAIKHHPRSTILAALAGAFSIWLVGIL